MRRLATVLAVLLLPALALATSTGLFSETQACTAGTCARAAAPTSTAEGMSMYGVDGFRLTVCAVNGQTLSGAGTMQAYFCDSVSTLCMRNPGLDQGVTATTQCQAFPDFQTVSITYAADTVVFAASGVTVSGGATITVRMYPHVGR